MSRRKRTAANNINDYIIDCNNYDTSTQDYTVQVHILNIKDIVGKNIDNSASPYIELKIDNMIHKSKVYKNINLECLINEKFTFEIKSSNLIKLYDTYLSILLKNKESFGQKDKLYGTFYISLGKIYDQYINRELYQASIDIIDDEYNNNAKMKLSILVLSTNDRAQEHNDDDDDDDTLDLKENQLELKILKVEDSLINEKAFALRISNNNKHIFLERGNVDIKGFILRSIKLPIYLPSIDPLLKIEIHEQNIFSNTLQQPDSNHALGVIFLDIEKIAKKAIKNEWITIYSAPLEFFNIKSLNKEISTAKKDMCNGYIEGSQCICRLLIQAKIIPKHHISIGNYKRIYSIRRPSPPLVTKYAIQMDLYTGLDINIDRIKIQLSIGKYSSTSNTIIVSNGRFKYFQALNDLEVRYSSDLNQVPDIFIYIINSFGDKISYKRFKFKDIVNKVWKSPPTWFLLLDNIAIIEPNMYDHNILFSLRAGPLNHKPARPYLISRPFCGYRDIYSMGYYNYLPPLDDTKPKLIKQQPQGEKEEEEEDGDEEEGKINEEIKVANEELIQTEEVQTEEVQTEEDNDNPKANTVQQQEEIKDDEPINLNNYIKVTKPKKYLTIKLNKIKKIGSLSLTIHKLINLPMNQRYPKIFLIIKIANKEYKSKIINSAINLNFNQLFEINDISIYFPLKIELYKINKNIGNKLIAYNSIDLLTQNHDYSIQQKLLNENNSWSIGHNFIINENWYLLKNIKNFFKRYIYSYIIIFRF